MTGRRWTTCVGLLACLGLQTTPARSEQVCSRSVTIQQLEGSVVPNLETLSRSATVQKLGSSLAPSAPAIARAFTISKNGGTTDVPAPPVDSQPLAFVLHGASPNPAHRVARMSYELADPRPVRLDLLDASGRRIRTLARSAWQAPGRYVVQWDGTDDDGATVPVGVYWLRLTAGSFEQSRKVVLLRD